jgi:16S rRNA (adenine1518-N6/adenine1519-N6)-dimethyltransferase
MSQHRARRRFSQNFLIDRACTERIVRAIGASQADHIVEIGSGLGALTEPMLAAAGQVDAIEVDRDVARLLEERLAGQGLRVHCTDFLTFDLCSLGSRLRVVGNLPYHISTPILFAVNEFRACVQDCHFMLQREVVDRMVAPAGSANYGRLSVMLQCRWQMQKLFDVPPTVFQPQPKVWSSIVRMRPEQRAEITDPVLFSRVVEAAFSQRRKTLRNALRSLATEQDFDTSGIDSTRRGETLSIADFANLANQMHARLSASSG